MTWHFSPLTKYWLPSLVKNLLPLTEIVGIAEATAANAIPHAMLREERILMENKLLGKEADLTGRICLVIRD